MHRALIAPFVAWTLYSTATSFAANYESAFPYDVRVVAADAALRCGPGEDFYITDRPAVGETLSVYRQAAGGWLAVRPTAASFSLLAARYVRQTAKTDIVEVIDEHAVSWVGSTEAQPTECKWQVRLKKGERLVVLGEETCRTFSGGPVESHFRISPPAGEFRWIREDRVRHASQPKIEQPTRSGNVTLTDYRVVVEDQKAESPRDDGFVARRPRTANTQRETTSVSDTPLRVARIAPREKSVTPRSSLPPLSASEFGQQLRDLDVRLSLTVAQATDDWDLDELASDVESLIVRGGTTVERARAQLFSEKVSEFQQLHARFMAAEGNPDPKDISQAKAVGETNLGEPDNAATPSGADPRFDGSGWLYPVHSRNQASPPYALLDANGTILHFVSPAPGLNLHRYLRSEIGIFGQQAVGSNLDKPHVTAERVVRLKRHRR